MIRRRQKTRNPPLSWGRGGRGRISTTASHKSLIYPSPPSPSSGCAAPPFSYFPVFFLPSVCSFCLLLRSVYSSMSALALSGGGRREGLLPLLPSLSILLLLLLRANSFFVKEAIEARPPLFFLLLLPEAPRTATMMRRGGEAPFPRIPLSGERTFVEVYGSIIVCPAAGRPAA